MTKLKKRWKEDNKSIFFSGIALVIVSIIFIIKNYDIGNGVLLGGGIVMILWGLNDKIF